MLIFGIISLSIILLILNVLIFGLVVLFERKRRVDELNKNLSLFSPTNLQRKMEVYSAKVESNEEILELNDQIKELTLAEYNKIIINLNNMKKLVQPINLFKFIYFSNLYKDSLSKIKYFEKEYLELRFTLFDLTSDIEIENAIINQLKDRTSSVRESLENSPIKKIRESEKINKRVRTLMNSLGRIDKVTSSQVKHLGKEFVELVVKIDKYIEEISSSIEFLNRQLKHLEEELKVPLKQIVMCYKENEKILEEVDKDIKTQVKEINILKKNIYKNIDELKQKEVNKDVLILDEKISKLNLLINSNIDFYKFLKVYDKEKNIFIDFIEENNGLFISEIKRHKLKDEKERITRIDDVYKNFKVSVAKYEHEKMNTYVKQTPQGAANLFLNIIHSYEDYIHVVRKNVKDISEINYKTNDMNNEIALMNTGLLQIEYNIRKVNGNIKDIFEKRKDILQDKVFELRRRFKNNTTIIEKESFQEVYKLKNEIDALVSETKGIAFEIFFIKEAILFINKYKGLDDKFDMMVISIENSFKDDKINDSLRKIKELLEIYGIKE